MTTFERIKEISKKKGYSSLRVLSENSGLGPNAIYQWRDKTPRIDSLQAVADVLDVSVDYLLGNNDKMHSNKKDDMPIDLEKTLSKLGPAVSFGGKELTDEQKLKFYEMAKLMFGE
ncbi:helix-turn-helix domain-containing protein [Weissella confusa]|uniref:helix-turn-helix domain-containing protein n=1 Tax=Weissella confusa TaxID=1583 RepID=UPI00223B6329|nr:helix-turn-helix transcriptional regulator [Weissella confusa]MCT0025324.1 XRE family transcriptional regulator [Weissella confusa]